MYEVTTAGERQEVTPHTVIVSQCMHVVHSHLLIKSAKYAQKMQRCVELFTQHNTFSEREIQLVK